MKLYTYQDLKKLFPKLTKQRLHQLRESYRSDDSLPRPIDYNKSMKLLHGVDFIRKDYHKVYYTLSGIRKIKKRIKNG